MSCVGFLDGDANLLKNEMLMSDVNLYPDGFLSLKEEEKDDEKSNTDDKKDDITPSEDNKKDDE